MERKRLVMCGVEMYGTEDLMEILNIKTKPAVSRWVKRHGIKGTWITVPLKKGKHHKKFYSRQQIVDIMTGER